MLWSGRVRCVADRGIDGNRWDATGSKRSQQVAAAAASRKHGRAWAPNDRETRSGTTQWNAIKKKWIRSVGDDTGNDNDALADRPGGRR